MDKDEGSSIGSRWYRHEYDVWRKINGRVTIGSSRMAFFDRITLISTLKWSRYKKFEAEATWIATWLDISFCADVEPVKGDLPTYGCTTKCWIRRWTFRRANAIEVRPRLSCPGRAVSLRKAGFAYWIIWSSGSGDPIDRRCFERISYWIVAVYVSGIRSGVEYTVDQ